MTLQTLVNQSYERLHVHLRPCLELFCGRTDIKLLLLRAGCSGRPPLQTFDARTPVRRATKQRAAFHAARSSRSLGRWPSTWSGSRGAWRAGAWPAQSACVDDFRNAALSELASVGAELLSSRLCMQHSCITLSAHTSGGSVASGCALAYRSFAVTSLCRARHSGVHQHAGLQG